MRSAETRPTLVHISYSPWSEKARWALDHHGIDYVRKEHVPMIGAPLLRWRTRNWTGRITAPALVTGGAVLGDSYDIARWAEQHGRGEPLFPAGDEAAIREWNDRSEALAAAGRARTTARALADREALHESVPPPLDRVPAVAGVVGRAGARFLARKYGFDLDRLEAHERTMRGVLGAAREALDANRDYLLGHFTYADVAMAAALQFVRPLEGTRIRLGPASRRIWTEPELSGEHADLLEWRDRVFARHR